MLKVRGLCGDMDGSVTAEHVSRYGIVEPVIQFVMSYSDCVESTPDNYTQPDPCAYDVSVSIVRLLGLTKLLTVDTGALNISLLALYVCFLRNGAAAESSSDELTVTLSTAYIEFIARLYRIAQ
jgi:hypothetical protein